MIKEDLGPGAVIISTRKKKQGSGAFGLFGKHVLEVTAARDERGKKTPRPLDSLLKKQEQGAPSDYQSEIEGAAPLRSRADVAPSKTNIIEPLQSDINDLKDLVMDLRQGYRRDMNDEATISHMRYELSEIKGLMNSLLLQSGELRDADLHENLIALYQQLTFNGIEEKFTRRLIEEVRKKIPAEEIENFSYVKIYVARMFMQVLKVDESFTQKQNPTSPRIITFLGPTGVGKTTTIAKIASREKLNNPDSQIGLITIDTFRIAAVQQLKEYARIIKVPIRVVNDREQLVNCLEEFKSKDLVLIDTAGRSQRDELQMTSLREFIRKEDPFKNLLVLSSTTKDSDLTEITKRFGSLSLDGIIFTKLDESTTYGSLFNHGIRFKLPISYLTTGQNVPEDIEPASRERLIDLLLNLSGD